MPAGRPTIRVRKVAAELRRLRARSGDSCRVVGEALGVSASKISRIETGQIGLQADEVAALLGYYRVPAPRREYLLGLVRRGGESGWWQLQGSRLPEQLAEFIDLEQDATAIANYEPLLVPGLVQTAEYARALIRAENPGLTDDEVADQTAARTARQTLLTRTDPPTFLALVEEGVLRRIVGSPALMRRQLRALEDAGTQDHITVRVVPTAAGAHPGLGGPLVFMEFADQPSLVHLENRRGSAFLEDDEDIAAARVAVRALQQIALSPADSTALLQGLIADLG